MVAFRLTISTLSSVPNSKPHWYRGVEDVHSTGTIARGKRTFAAGAAAAGGGSKGQTRAPLEVGAYRVLHLIVQNN